MAIHGSPYRATVWDTMSIEELRHSGELERLRIRRKFVVKRIRIRWTTLYKEQPPNDFLEEFSLGSRLSRNRALFDEVHP